MEIATLINDCIKDRLKPTLNKRIENEIEYMLLPGLHGPRCIAWFLYRTWVRRIAIPFLRSCIPK
jgi:hypothetical protein